MNKQSGSDRYHYSVISSNITYMDENIRNFEQLKIKTFFILIVRPQPSISHVKLAWWFGTTRRR